MKFGTDSQTDSVQGMDSIDFGDGTIIDRSGKIL